ncbi:MAG: nucleotide exchange factor GrpE [Legionellales bacterium]|nr:nucleotide exchange factor GrpE [Legionellales bacterium]
MSSTNDEQKQKQKQWERIAQEAEQDTEQPAPSMAEDENLETLESEPADQLDHPSYAALENKLTATEAKMHKYWDQAMRMKAELENVERRAKRDVEQAHRYALGNFGSDLIPVMDSLEQALQLQVDDNLVAQQIHQGIELTLKLFLSVLQKFGIEQLNPVGEPFNPEHHEAMTMQEQADVATNTVISVFQKGYLLNGRIIRPARVVVAK